MKKEIMIDGGDMATMSLDYVNDGYYGTAGFIHGHLYTGVVYHLSKENYEYLRDNLGVFIQLFRVVVKTAMRRIELMGMTLETDDGFNWELR